MRNLKKKKKEPNKFKNSLETAKLIKKILTPVHFKIFEMLSNLQDSRIKMKVNTIYQIAYHMVVNQKINILNENKLKTNIVNLINYAMEEVLSVPTILIQYLAAFTANDLIVQYANLKDHLIKKSDPKLLQDFENLRRSYSKELNFSYDVVLSSPATEDFFQVNIFLTSIITRLLKYIPSIFNGKKLKELFDKKIEEKRKEVLEELKDINYSHFPEDFVFYVEILARFKILHKINLYDFKYAKEFELDEKKIDIKAIKGNTTRSINYLKKHYEKLLFLGEE